MADLFSVTAPLAISSPKGGSHYLAEVFKHPKGLLCFRPYWHQLEPDEGIYLIKGWIAGEGPWKISEHIISVLACHNTEACPATEFNEWQAYRQSNPGEYPPEPMIKAIAARMGAMIES